ncbi:hypothetical protein M3Y97_00201500 [Aphelenchoides bicaudatus]|nr:hypothetical protein M3Y97_00201500 [Aphelenchoides bicaudatus]
MSPKLLHDFGQNNNEEPENPDVKTSLPNLFNLRKVGNDYCSDPDQVVGIFSRNRVFGGQTFVQFYLVAKQLATDQFVKRLDIIFYTPGKATQPILYRQTLKALNSQFISMEAVQNGRLIACGHARLSKLEPFDYIPQMPNDIPHPLDCLPIKEAQTHAFLDTWTKKWGSSLNTATLENESELFEIRPVNFESYCGLNSDFQKMQAWLRLAPHLQDIELKDPMFVPLTVCDYLACQPSITALDQRHIHFTSGASLTHKVCIHRTKGFNPKGYFLVENILETLSSGLTGLYNGRVFDESGQCILNFSQMNFNQVQFDSKGLKPKI